VPGAGIEPAVPKQPLYGTRTLLRPASAVIGNSRSVPEFRLTMNTRSQSATAKRLTSPFQVQLVILAWVDSRI
jgi:hypothetical protein